jgi:hypothetical protein
MLQAGNTIHLEPFLSTKLVVTDNETELSILSSLTISCIVFACLFGGALLGTILRSALPEHHLGSESKETMKLGMGLIGTMAALVLGLMVSSAKSSYDAQKNELTQMSARIIMLDRVLANFGPETKETRAQLRASVARVIEKMWPDDASQSSQLDPAASRAEALYDAIQQLSPKNESQRFMQNQALNIAFDIGQRRWVLFQQSGSSISKPFLVVLAFWLSIIFASFGVMAPRNATVLATLLLCALAVSGAVFLILELDRPFDGFIQIPSEPLRKALAALGT